MDTNTARRLPVRKQEQYDRLTITPRAVIDAKTLLALRQEGDGAQSIAERLHVKEMGPADHIRTKHEVKTFVESGDTRAAENRPPGLTGGLAESGETREFVIEQSGIPDRCGA
jgi:6-phosphogluconolactonase/glucosamine-6-phosphate isomerase/deaminase